MGYTECVLPAAMPEQSLFHLVYCLIIWVDKCIVIKSVGFHYFNKQKVVFRGSCLAGMTELYNRFVHSLALSLALQERKPNMVTRVD